MRNAVFGDWEGAPTADGAPVIPTPVGDRCSKCNYAFEAGDAGMRMGYLGPDAEQAVAIHVHRWCFVMNTVGHLFGVCRCHGWEYGPEAGAELRRRTREEAWRN